MNDPGYVCLNRGEHSHYLLTKDAKAWCLLSLAALRARWSKSPSLEGLSQSEAFLGADDVERCLGLTEKEYRNALKRLVRYQQIHVKALTGVGTIVTLADTCVFSVTAGKRAGLRAGLRADHSPSEKQYKRADSRAGLRAEVGQNRGGSGATKEEGKERKEGNTLAQAKPAQARDELFMALARAEGSDPEQLTDSAAKSLEVALAQIRRASPMVTPDEIMVRARAYPRVMPSGTRITGHALAKHWAKCGGRAVTVVINRSRTAVDGPARWREALDELYPTNTITRDEKRSWASIDASAQKAVEEFLARPQQKACA